MSINYILYNLHTVCILFLVVVFTIICTSFYLVIVDFNAFKSHTVLLFEISLLEYKFSFYIVRKDNNSETLLKCRPLYFRRAKIIFPLCSPKLLHSRVVFITPLNNSTDKWNSIMKSSRTFLDSSRTVYVPKGKFSHKTCKI